MTSTNKPQRLSRKEKVEKLLELATSYEGYSAAAGSPDIFSSKVGKPGAHWNGIYVDVVMMEAGFELPTTHVATAAALRYYMMSGRLHTKPKPGDVAFFTFPTDSESGPYNQMHVGIVTGSENFLRDGSFKVIEGQIDAGLPRGGRQPRNGVHVRTRYATDVVGFGRPALVMKSLTDGDQDPEQLKLSTKPVIKASIMKPGLKHKQVTVLQLELRMNGLLVGSTTGILDARTISAFANFQRSIGYVGSEVTGIPDKQSLNRLAQIRQTFNVTD
jgi:hypothetical protein